MNGGADTKTSVLWFALGCFLTLIVAIMSQPWLRYVQDNLPLTPFYLLPIIVCAWSARPGWSLALTCFTAVVLFFATHKYAPTRSSMWTMVILQFVTYNIVAATVTHLRAGLRREWGQARRDALTGLLNGRGFHEVATKEIQRMRRYNGTSLAVAYFDIDNFKGVNDSEGHSAGDVALKVIANATKLCVRVPDTIARVGGDEFVLLMPETDYEGAKVVAKRLRQQVAALSRNKLSCSIGCVAFERAPANVDELLHAADAAMYAAKGSGKNQAAFVRAGSDAFEFDASDAKLALAKD